MLLLPIGAISLQDDHLGHHYYTLFSVLCYYHKSLICQTSFRGFFITKRQLDQRHTENKRNLPFFGGVALVRKQTSLQGAGDTKTLFSLAVHLLNSLSGCTNIQHLFTHKFSYMQNLNSLTHRSKVVCNSTASWNSWMWMIKPSQEIFKQITLEQDSLTHTDLAYSPSRWTQQQNLETKLIPNI